VIDNRVLPFLSSYDPGGRGEGSLDPMGLYQIADKLAVMLVPVIRERMQRVRFITPIAVGAYVTAGIDDPAKYRDSSPHLVWEWLVVEALVARSQQAGNTTGIPGTLVTRNAIANYGNVTATQYLKTPRIFGFHGVYKALAIHLDLVNFHFGSGPQMEHLLDAWARDQGFGSFSRAESKLKEWHETVQRCCQSTPPRTNPNFTKDDWDLLAKTMHPDHVGERECGLLTELLRTGDSNRRLGALEEIWQLQKDFSDDQAYSNQDLHRAMISKGSEYSAVLLAIQKYEAFSRAIHDAFNMILAHGSCTSGSFSPVEIQDHEDFSDIHNSLQDRYGEAVTALEIATDLCPVFEGRFGTFGHPMNQVNFVQVLLDHHERIQKQKSVEGKRTWFDRTGNNSIYIRPGYRADQVYEVKPDNYVHTYRAWPIRFFYKDLQKGLK